MSLTGDHVRITAHSDCHDFDCENWLSEASFPEFAKLLDEHLIQPAGILIRFDLQTRSEPC